MARNQEKIRSLLRLLTKVIVGLSGLTVLLVAGALYLVLRNNPGRDVTVDFSYTEPAYIGAPLDISLLIQNKTGQPLKNVSLRATGGDGVSIIGKTDEPVGDIDASGFVKKTVRIIAAPLATGGAYQLSAKLSYEIGAGDFQQTYTYTLPLTAPAFTIVVTSPPRIVNGSEFDISVEYRNATDTAISGVAVKLENPSEFTITKTSGRNNSWTIGDVPAGADGTFSFSGFWYGSTASAANTSPSLALTLSTEVGGTAYPLATYAIPLEVGASPLSLSVSCDKGAVARAGDTLTYTISYNNQSGVALRDAALTARLTGEMLSLGSLSSNGYVNAGQGRVTWDKQIIPALALLQPGDRGAVAITVPLSPDFPTRRLSDKNFTAKLEARITSPTVPYYIHASELSALAAYTVSIAGEAHVSAAAYYRDAQSGIANSGTFPPRTGTATEYTIHWKLKNYSTDLQHTVVRAALPDSVTPTGASKATDGTAPYYDMDTHDMVWDVGALAATRGILDAPPEAVFQVSATPTETMKGSYMLLLYQTRLSADDAFTGIQLSDTADAVTTQLSGDTTVSPQEGIVQ